MEYYFDDLQVMLFYHMQDHMLTRKSLSTYPSGREESHTMCDLFSKQHHVICCQVVDPSDPMMILVENPPGFSEITQQVTSPQVLHDKYWLS